MKTLVVLTGPTGIGKTSLSILLAQKLNSEIISCDSRQFYKELKIGTACPSKTELEKVKHHFISNLSINDNYNAGQFEIDALRLIKKLHKKNDYVLMVGGSGLFIHAVCNGFDNFPNSNKKIRADLNKKLKEKGIKPLQYALKKNDPKYFKLVDVNNPQRIIRALEVYYSSGKPYSFYLDKKKPKRDFKIIKVCLNIPRALLYQKINTRVDKMIGDGLIEEAKQLNLKEELNALQTVGYKELFSYFDGTLTKEEAIMEIKKNTRRYAKRQLTWFKKDKKLIWINSSDNLFDCNIILKNINIP